MVFRHFSSIFKEINKIKQRKSYIDVETKLVRPPVLKRNNEAIFCDEHELVEEKSIRPSRLTQDIVRSMTGIVIPF